MEVGAYGCHISAVNYSNYVNNGATYVISIKVDLYSAFFWKNFRRAEYASITQHNIFVYYELSNRSCRQE